MFVDSLCKEEVFDKEHEQDCLEELECVDGGQTCPECGFVQLSAILSSRLSTERLRTLLERPLRGKRKDMGG